MQDSIKHRNCGPNNNIVNVLSKITIGAFRPTIQEWKWLEFISTSCQSVYGILALMLLQAPVRTSVLATRHYQKRIKTDFVVSHIAIWYFPNKSPYIREYANILLNLSLILQIHVVFISLCHCYKIWHSCLSGTFSTTTKLRHIATSGVAIYTNCHHTICFFKSYVRSKYSNLILSSLFMSFRSSLTPLN